MGHVYLLLDLHFDLEKQITLQIKTPIDRVRAIISIRPLITDTQTNT